LTRGRAGFDKQGRDLPSEGALAEREVPADVLVLVAHDLKNPVTALLANLHYLRGGADPSNADTLDAVDDAISLCAVLDRFISNLDTVARGPTLPSSRAPVSIRQLGAEVILRQSSFAAAVGLTLELDARVDDGVLVVVDGELFLRAAANLVSNAIEHAPARSCITIEIARSEHEASLTVVDRGAAVPVELREPAMAMRGQVSGRSRPGARFGRGLGLLAANIAAEAAGARLEIDGEATASRLRLVATVGE
jgi:two-component system sensor histidine kinase KdpD